MAFPATDLDAPARAPFDFRRSPLCRERTAMLFAPSQDPLAITLLVLPETSLMTLAATVDPMRAANRVAGREVYRWEIVSLDGTAPATSCGLPVPVDGAF